jgi:hypothetical protein
MMNDGLYISELTKRRNKSRRDIAIMITSSLLICALSLSGATFSLYDWPSSLADLPPER